MKRLLVYLMICFFSCVSAMDQQEEARNYENPVIARFHEMPGMTPEGLAAVNVYLDQVGRNLSEDELRTIFDYALRGTLDPHPYLLMFWGVVEDITDPLAQLCLLGCAVIPMISLGDDDNGKLSKLVTSALAMGSIVFGKMHGYAENKKKDLENLRMFLHAIVADADDADDSSGEDETA